MSAADARRRVILLLAPLGLLLVVGACNRPIVRNAARADDADSIDTWENPADGYTEERKALVKKLQRDGIEDERVLKVILKTPRHEFVPPAQKPHAYVDSALPIGEDQTISQPYIVAFMTWKLKPRKTDVVLEIGTGSGYQAAVLAPLVKHVYTIEIIESLGESAKERLKEMGYENITVRIGDGYKGWPEHAPFDKIIVTCAPTKPPQPLVDQLKEGGTMIIPCGEGWDQELYVLEKRDGKVEQRAVLPVVFVPMTGEAEGD